MRFEKRGELTSALDALVERIRDMAGCLSCRLLVDVEDANSMRLTSEWSDFASAAAYFESHEFNVFRGVKILLRDEPRVVLDEVSSRITETLRGY